MVSGYVVSGTTLGFNRRSNFLLKVKNGDYLQQQVFFMNRWMIMNSKEEVLNVLTRANRKPILLYLCPMLNSAYQTDSDISAVTL